MWTDKVAEWRTCMASFSKENAQFHSQLCNTWQVVHKLAEEAAR